MQWEQLFRDLEAQMEAAEQAELVWEVADRTRRERATVRLADRLAAQVGASLALRTEGGGSIRGTLMEAAPEWLLLVEEPPRSVLVATAAVLALSGVEARATAAEEAPTVLARLGQGYALRALARDRAEVTVILRDATAVTGTVEVVGADFFELAEHALGEPRSRGARRSLRCVPFGGWAVIRES